MTHAQKERLAKAFGRANGYHGKPGGWIYFCDGSRAICQGWASLFDARRNTIREWLFREIGQPEGTLLP